MRGIKTRNRQMRARNYRAHSLSSHVRLLGVLGLGGGLPALDDGLGLLDLAPELVAAGGGLLLVVLPLLLLGRVPRLVLGLHPGRLLRRQVADTLSVVRLAAGAALGPLLAPHLLHLGLIVVVLHLQVADALGPGVLPIRLLLLPIRLLLEVARLGLVRHPLLRVLAAQPVDPGRVGGLLHLLLDRSGGLLRAQHPVGLHGGPLGLGRVQAAGKEAELDAAVRLERADDGLLLRDIVLLHPRPRAQEHVGGLWRVR
mmetsp:Transcript_17404/g.46084  ORF Transcript_17404/g.46084 Transcript_17404/m.46084 type:complete len:256 (-) Transcript_17404:1418-2185(-)